MWHSTRAPAALLAFSLGCAGAQQLPVLAPEDLYERLAPSVWRVHADRGRGKASLGSAVVVGPDTLVTSCHVVDEAQALSLQHGARRVAARLQYRDPGRDLCQLQAGAPLQAPPVTIAGAASLRVGAKVYAIGSPRGLELTLSDGLLSGLRRDAAGSLQLLQVTVPISAGSSGGGLFDVHGRLVGITSAALERAQAINFALPADWIAQLPQRHSAARRPPAAAPATPEAPSPATLGRVLGGPPALPPGVGYRLQDRLQRSERQLLQPLEQLTGDNAADAGEFGLAMPPRGWLPDPPRPGTAWQREHELRPAGALPVTLRLRARAFEGPALPWSDRQLATVRVEFKGSLLRPGTAPQPWQATAWWAPALERIVRFEVRSHAGVGGAAVDQVLELVPLPQD